MIPLHYVITGLDTMPDVFIHQNNKAFHKKIDFLFYELICPSVLAILKKHDLRTNLDLFHNFISDVRTTALNKKYAAYIYTDSDNIFKVKLNDEKSFHTAELLMKIVENEEVDEKRFNLGKYSISSHITNNM